MKHLNKQYNTKNSSMKQTIYETKLEDWSQINTLQIDIIKTMLNDYKKSKEHNKKQQIAMCMKSLLGL